MAGGGFPSKTSNKELTDEIRRDELDWLLKTTRLRSELLIESISDI